MRRFKYIKFMFFLIHSSAQIQYSIPESLEIPDTVTYPLQYLNLIIGTLDKTIRQSVFGYPGNLATPFSKCIYAVTEFWKVEFSD